MPRQHGGEAQLEQKAVPVRRNRLPGCMGSRSELASFSNLHFKLRIHGVSGREELRMTYRRPRLFVLGFRCDYANEPQPASDFFGRRVTKIFAVSTRIDDDEGESIMARGLLI